jgi:hypothetical protein
MVGVVRMYSLEICLTRHALLVVGFVLAHDGVLCST